MSLSLPPDLGTMVPLDHGRPFETEASGWQARVFQHEIDHLDGTLCLARMHGPRYLTKEEYMAYASVPGPELRRILGW